jgi:hypothetical protein
MELTRHHLVPRMVYRQPRVQRRFAGTDPRTHLALLCRPCHKFLHAMLTEKQLAEGFSTLEQLRQHREVQRFVHWLETKPPGLRARTRKPRRF